MMTIELRSASSTQSTFRKSSAGYEFDESSDKWILDGSVTIHLAFLKKFAVEEETAIGFRKSLSHFAQDLSSRYCASICDQTIRFLKITKAKIFSKEALSGYQANLDDDRKHYLGVLRSFLDSWYEWEYPGVTAESIEYLDGLTIRGGPRGIAVLTNCPYSGPYTALEHESLLYGLANAYEVRSLTQHDYSFLLAVSMTGQRPIQVRHLKFCDLDFEDKDGARAYYLDVPKGKQRGGKTFRAELKRMMICKELFDALNDQRNDVISWVDGAIGKLEEGVESLLPLFPEYKRLARYEPSTIESHLDYDFLHTNAGSTNTLRKRLNAAVIANSERTGERLIIGFTRLRRTFATNLAAEGFGPLVIAEALSHSDTQQVHVYARPENETAKFVDAVMAPVLAPLAMAFAGTLADSERDALRGNDPHSRVKIDTKNSVGNCGSHAFCADGWKSCYACKNFQPWLDGPHTKARDELLLERQEQLDAGISNTVISASDRILLAITQVIQLCDRKKEEMNLGKAGAQP